MQPDQEVDSASDADHEYMYILYGDQEYIYFRSRIYILCGESEYIYFMGSGNFLLLVTYFPILIKNNCIFSYTL